MQRLEVRGAVRPIYRSLGVKRLSVWLRLPQHFVPKRERLARHKTLCDKYVPNTQNQSILHKSNKPEGKEITWKTQV